MYKSGNANPRDYSDYITSALETEGGHLSVGRGGFILWFGRGARLSGYDCEHIKVCCIAAGLPVIDSRVVAFQDGAPRCSGTNGGGQRGGEPTALSRALFRPAQCGGGSLSSGRRRGLQPP